MSTADYQHIESLGMVDAAVLKRKGETYGDSWKQRGGVGAFMMLARKWDRIENQVASFGHKYDIFCALEASIISGEKEGLLDDIQDLRRYLLLVESYVVLGIDDGEPTSAYVDQD